MQLKNIQALRGLAAFSVILVHLIAIEGKYSHDTALLPQTPLLFQLGIDLFFVISGFIMALVSQRKTAALFLKDRVTRIYPLYWFYSALALLAASFMTINSSFEAQPSALKSFLLIPQETQPLLAVGWTLIHEMYFYFVFTFILFLTRHHKENRDLFLFGWGCLILLAAQSHASPLFTLATHPLSFEFIFGTLLGLFVIEKRKRSALLLIALLCLSVFRFESAPLLDNSTFPHAILFGSLFTLLVFLAVSAEKRNLVTPLFLQKIGDSSFSLYLSHVFVISALGKIFFRLPWHTPVTEAFFLLICLSASLAFGMISYRWIEKPLTRLARWGLSTGFFFGGRKSKKPL